MKSSAFLSMSLSAAIFFCTASCGEQSSQKNSETTSQDSMATTAPANRADTARSTVVTTPQNMMVVMHKVKDFNKWKASYDAHDSARMASGIHNYVIGRGLKDSDMVMVVLKVDDINKAKAFAKDASLKQAMQKGGVMGTPQISFTTMTYQDTATISTDLRSRATFKVKDWNEWQQKFNAAQQMRMANGLMSRAVGHDADDDHKVTVVAALIDSAKAFAYWKSDQMKQMQDSAGLVTKPERFLFRIVQRY